MKTTNKDNKGKTRKSKDILVSDCIFPFKYKSKIYNSCVPDKTGEWCATQISKRQTKTKWAYCKNSKQKKTISKKKFIVKTDKKVKTNKTNCDSKNWKSMWGIKSNGLMLAHTYKDPKTGKIKKTPKGFPQAPNGWYLSEKFDGYRCLWDGKNFYSRGGNIFVTPEWFKAYMPPGIPLDGELYLGRENFEKCGIFRKKKPDNAEWIKWNVKYLIFDSPNCPGGFEKRIQFLEKIIADRCKCNKKKLKIPSNVNCPLILAKQIKVKNEAEVEKYFKNLVKKGAEGVMLRAPNSLYETKRSAFLLKVKQFFDDECKIVGYQEGSGKYSGMLGSFKCELVKNPKIKFTISGINDTIRKNYKKTHPIGTIVTFTYMGTSSKGIPRHPNYLRIRK